MTRDEAIAAARADGVADADLTDAVLAEYMDEEPDPLAGYVPPVPAVSDADVAQQGADLATEAAGNTTGAQVLDGVAKAAAIAGQVLGVTVKP